MYTHSTVVVSASALSFFLWRIVADHLRGTTDKIVTGNIDPFETLIYRTRVYPLPPPLTMTKEPRQQEEERKNLRESCSTDESAAVLSARERIDQATKHIFLVFQSVFVTRRLLEISFSDFIHTPRMGDISFRRLKFVFLFVREPLCALHGPASYT